MPFLFSRSPAAMQQRSLSLSLSLKRRLRELVAQANRTLPADMRTNFHAYMHGLVARNQVQLAQQAQQRRTANMVRRTVAQGRAASRVPQLNMNALRTQMALARAPRPPQTKVVLRR